MLTVFMLTFHNYTETNNSNFIKTGGLSNEENDY